MLPVEDENPQPPSRTNAYREVLHAPSHLVSPTVTLRLSLQSHLVSANPVHSRFPGTSHTLPLLRLLRKLRLATNHLVPYTQLDDATLLRPRTLRARLATFHLLRLRFNGNVWRNHCNLFTSVELAAQESRLFAEPVEAWSVAGLLRGVVFSTFDERNVVVEQLGRPALAIPSDSHVQR